MSNSTLECQPKADEVQCELTCLNRFFRGLYAHSSYDAPRWQFAAFD